MGIQRIQGISLEDDEDDEDEDEESEDNSDYDYEDEHEEKMDENKEEANSYLQTVSSTRREKGRNRLMAMRWMRSKKNVKF